MSSISARMILSISMYLQGFFEFLFYLCFVISKWDQPLILFLFLVHGKSFNLFQSGCLTFIRILFNLFCSLFFHFPLFVCIFLKFLLVCCIEADK